MKDPKRTAVRPGWSLLALLAAACGSDSGGSGGGGGTEQASVTLSVTDAPSDEVAAFRVELESFRLRRSSGAQVSVLSAPVELDLASLADLGQVLGVAGVPVGTYTSAEVTLDFSDALCALHGATAPAEILDPDGNPLDGALTLPIDLSLGALVAEAGQHVLLELDFDLDQSLVVDSAANAVQLEPVLVLRVDPLAPKELLALGVLESVDLAASSFRLEAQTLTGAALGTFDFESTPQTVFHVDGVPAVGPDGLASLAGKGAGTSTQVWAAFDPGSAHLSALHVAAGSGTFFGGSDIVEGHVLWRSSGAGTSPNLIVRGQGVDASHTAFQFDQTFSVATSLAATKVVRLGDVAALDMDDVNVGQRVRVFGALDGTSLDATQPQDVIRLEPTRAIGFAVQEPSGGVLVLDLVRIGPIEATAFAWGAGGDTPPDPDALTADVTGLAGGLGIGVGTAVEASGHFAPLDDAGEDFAALSLANLTTGPALLVVRDRADLGFELSVAASPTAILLVIVGTAAPGEVALVDKGFLGVLQLPALPTPRLEPPLSGPTLYLLTDKVSGSATLYFDFTTFSAALAQAFAGGAEIAQVAAIGQYDWPSNTMVTPLASVCVR